MGMVKNQAKNEVMIMNARQVAFEVLLKIKIDAAYSNNAITTALVKHKLSNKDKALVTEIVYGTLTHYKLLHYWLTPYLQGRKKQWIRILLAMTLYQIVYLDKIPGYAAIHEAVEIAKGRGGEFNGKIVNAVLRKATATDGLRDVNEIEDVCERLAIWNSHPTWLVRLWMSQFGEERTVAMLRANNERARMVLRTNMNRISRDLLISRLAKEGIECLEGMLCPSAILVTSGNPLTTDSFKDGLFYVQDEASMLPAKALAPTKGAWVLDVCAAPGGKTFHLAEMVGELGIVYAHDIYDHKIARIKENMERLGINNVETSICLAADLNQLYEPGSFDYILVDAPCSGLGILRRHPEAKLTKRPEDLDEIAQIQKEILGISAKFLKPSGRLVYSTCTLNRKENQRQIEEFLKEFEDFTLDSDFESKMPTILKDNFTNGMLQLFPQDFATDGFFIAALIKK